MDTVAEKNVLEEALSLVSGDRQDTYGHPYDDAKRFAAVASAITGLEIQPHHFPRLMMAVKISRIGNNRWHRDSFVDLAGYTLLAEVIQHTEEELDDVADAQKATSEFVGRLP